MMYKFINSSYGIVLYLLDAAESQQSVGFVYEWIFFFFLIIERKVLCCIETL